MTKCRWCSASFKKKCRSQSYCSDLCRRRATSQMDNTAVELSVVVGELGKIQRDILRIKHNLHQKIPVRRIYHPTRVYKARK